MFARFAIAQVDVGRVEDPIVNPTHICYSDESNWNKGQFRSVCIISLPIDKAAKFESEIVKQLADSDVAEFKWKYLESAKYRFAAEKILRIVFDYVCHGVLRVDTIVWDVCDSRHTIRHRDDVANLGRMYFHILNNVLKERWPHSAVWHLCPDEHNELDWGTLHEILDYKSVISREHDLFDLDKKCVSFTQILHKVYRIVKIDPCKSHERCLVQVSDLFAGLACFSKEHFVTYQKWVNQTSSQLSLFDGDPVMSMSNSQEQRFPLLRTFREECGRRKLGVSLESSGALTTPNPRNPINFWWYKPQSSLDKAPVSMMSC